MSKGINKMILVGNCGGDPETKHFDDGGAITNITVATSESWKDKQTGEQKETTEWHRVSLRDRGNFKMGDLAGQWLYKGCKVYIEGKLKTRKYEKDGVERYVTEVIASEFQVLSPRDMAGTLAPQQQQQQQQPFQSRQEFTQQLQQQQRSPGQQQRVNQNAPPSLYDDVPF